MGEQDIKVINLEDVDLIITIRSGSTDLKALMILLKSLIASLKFQSQAIEIVTTDQIINIRTSPDKKLTTVTSSYHLG